MERRCGCKVHYGDQERPMCRYVESSRPLRPMELAILMGLAIEAVHERCCGGAK